MAIAIVLLSMVRRYRHPDAWQLTKIPWREALRIKPEDGFLYSNLPLYGATSMVEQTAAAGSTVFTFIYRRRPICAAPPPKS